MAGDSVQEKYGDLTYRIIGEAMAVHGALGPGFPEDFYQRALMIELAKCGLHVEQEKPIQVLYGSVSLGVFYLDFLVEDSVIVELKAIERLGPQHQQQVISYLAASGREVALLINFGAASLEYKRILPPRAVQQSKSYQSRVQAWQQSRKQRPALSDESYQSAPSAESADKES